MVWSRRAALGAAGLLVVAAVTGCGAGSGAAGAAPETSSARTPGGSGSSAARDGMRTRNPAMLAALEIIRLQPVVPFSQQQVQELVPILQSLADNPNLPPDQLAAKAQQIEATFTDLQKQALQNMESNTFPFPQRGQAGGATSGGRSGTAAGRPRGPSGSAASPRSSGQPGPGAPHQAQPGAIYQAAINVLEGKSTPQFGFGGRDGSGGPGGGTAAGLDGASGGGGTGDSGQ